MLWGFLVNTLVQMCSGRFPLTQPFVQNCFLDFYWTTSASLLVRAVLKVEEHFRKCTFCNSSKQVICEDLVVRSLVNHFCQPLRASTFENIRALLKVYFCISGRQPICEYAIVCFLVNHFCQPLAAGTFENMTILTKYILHFYWTIYFWKYTLGMLANAFLQMYFWHLSRTTHLWRYIFCISIGPFLLASQRGDIWKHTPLV